MGGPGELSDTGVETPRGVGSYRAEAHHGVISYRVWGLKQEGLDGVMEGDTGIEGLVGRVIKVDGIGLVEVIGLFEVTGRVEPLSWGQNIAPIVHGKR